MTAVPRSPRTAATLRRGDVLHLDGGRSHTVETVTYTTNLSALGNLILTVRLTDGGQLRVAACAEFDVERRG